MQRVDRGQDYVDLLVRGSQCSVELFVEEKDLLSSSLLKDL